MTRLKLYVRPDCHLCEVAVDLLQALDSSLVPDLVNVEGDIDLEHCYGKRLPVLQRQDTGAELGWPFDAERLADFLELPEEVI